MISEGQLDSVMGSTAYDRDGDKIGKVGGVFLDDTTGAPSWVSVSTGMFGGKDTLAPLDDASFDGDRLNLNVDKAQVKDAPKMDVDSHLSVEEEQELYRYYGRETTTTATRSNDTTQVSGDAGYTTDTDDRTERGTVGHDTSGPNTDDAMTRSEERLRVGTESVETGKARLRKYVVTENVTRTVPVSHEEVRIEREPITDANRGDALSGGDLTSEEHEVTLHAERAVVDKETVPVERVRLDTETVRSEETVQAEVSKEEIEMDGDETGRTRTTDDTTTRNPRYRHQPLT
ncbi:MAG: PRC and DUF2382 domain-containing protein [Geodermatophilaceae bacterium]